jgi:predicted deacylase
VDARPPAPQSMNDPSTAASPERLPRVLGDFRGAEDGPLVLAMGGIHGNEPAGIDALRRVFAALERARPAMRGRLVGLAGNLRALESRTRFLDVDLNRAWEAARMEGLEELEDGRAETREQKELLEVLRGLLADARHGAYFVDLHTSSAEGEPFACIGDTIRNRRFARAFPVPIILGLEEQIDGALLEFLNQHGLVTLGFEGGQHDSEDAVDAHEAAVWRALVGAGCLAEGAMPEIEAARKHLEDSRHDLPQWLGIRYRHAITPEDGFRMRPGYRNFRRLVAGEVVAEDHQGPIEAHYRSRILLPLYQGKGDDGFFLALDIHPWWLAISRWMRRLKVDRIAHWLPGVRKVPGDPDALRVDRRVARWGTVEFFHLLGLRKRRIFEDHMVVRRRRFDLKGPERYEI